MTPKIFVDSFSFYFDTFNRLNLMLTLALLMMLLWTTGPLEVIL